MFLAIWNADTKAATCGFSQHPPARRCSMSANFISKQLITRGGSSTEEKNQF